MDALNPPPSLLAKIGSAIVHLDEMSGPAGHHFDKAALDQVMSDPEVKEWLEAMAELALVPRKRK